MNFLLNDEKTISDNDYKIRKELYDTFITLPSDFLSRMRHFQPQIGCFNNCSFCSKFSVCKSEHWNESTIRNIISAIKYAALNYTHDEPLLAWNRFEHRLGVIFPYLDNDIGSYPYLDKFIELGYKELGVKTRISTVGFSRHNLRLNEMHKFIASSNLVMALAGVRLSISQYGRVYEDKNSNTSLEEYQHDISNFLKIYKPYYDKFGTGSRKMCVELRYNPLVVNSCVIISKFNDYMVLATGNYLFISIDKNVVLNESFVSDPYTHALTLSEKPVYFKEYHLPFIVDNEKQLVEYLINNDMKPIRICEVYKFNNNDGEYYAINPRLEDNGNYGFNIYPETKRRKSGYIITERFFLNAICEFKQGHGMTLRDKYQNSTWNDVLEVLSICYNIANEYKKNEKLDKYEYIINHVIPLISVYIEALKEAGYPSDAFFDSKFTIDTGMICNLGRAINLFGGLTTSINEPLTPTHERNYGRHCSTMKQENYVWRLSCGYNDSIIIEKLELFNTASKNGQTSFRKIINIDNINEKVTEKDKYLYPGAKE